MIVSTENKIEQSNLFFPDRIEDCLISYYADRVIISRGLHQDLWTYWGSFALDQNGNLTGGTITGVVKEHDEFVIDFYLHGIPVGHYERKIDVTGSGGDIDAIAFFGLLTAADYAKALNVLFAGDDVISGDTSSPLSTGSIKADFIFGGGGNDVLNGHGGDDTIDGGDGDDIINGHFGKNLLIGGRGDDLIYYSQDAIVRGGRQRYPDL